MHMWTGGHGVVGAGPAVGVVSAGPAGGVDVEFAAGNVWRLVYMDGVPMSWTIGLVRMGDRVMGRETSGERGRKDGGMVTVLQ